MNSAAGRPSIQSTVNRALALHQGGRLDEAEALYRLALGADPRQFEALHFLGLIEAQRGRYDEARALMSRSLEINRRVADAHSNYARVLNALKRSDEALAACERALKIDPRSLEALVSRGIALHDLGRYAPAVQSYERVLAVKPDHAAALVNRGNTLLELGRYEEGLASHDKAVERNPRDIDGWAGRGRALALLNRYAEALASCDKALALNPAHLAARLSRAAVLRLLRRFDEALVACDQVLAIEPNQADALFHRGGALVGLDRNAEAIACYEATLAADPNHRLAFNSLLETAAAACDWAKLAALTKELPSRLGDERTAIAPFNLLSCSADPFEHQRCAHRFLERWLPRKAAADRERTWDRSEFSGDKLRIAYLSADFNRHATAHLMAELFEIHDRQRFEIVGISFGRDDRSALRLRLVNAFDRFFDVSTRTDQQIAKLIRDLKTHIAIDLKGHTTDARIGILADRVAPVQVSYLGYPGSTGADFMDYIIADPIVLPFDQQRWYTEKIVHLPDSYQVNDSRRSIVPTPPTRSVVGLPDHGFVFCAFNNSWKINRPIFDIWMRLLQRIDGSVLWLLHTNSLAADSLRKEAQARAVDPARLVFAPRLDQAEHLARHHLADLFLDTLPVNAHTTASDALWSGLPVVTCIGPTFAGRVAASLLHAVGLPELVTADLSDYEALANRLATDPSQLRAIREKLARNLHTHPLFDTQRFRRHLETAYIRMWETWQRGEPPQSFRVDE